MRIFETARPVYVPVQPSSVAKGVIVFLVIFLLVFPKGGIKLGDIPLTWGYLGLAIGAFWLPIALLLGHPLRLRRVRLLVLAAQIPFQLVIWLTLLSQGTRGMGFAISLVVTFFFLPAMFVGVLGVHLDRIRLEFLFRLIRGAVVFVAAYGIFLFFYKLLIGSFVEIPYLTVNAGDMGELETSKFIDRGGVFKLISTYNNGNLYGISILLILPLFAWLEHRASRLALVKLSLVLTLSRTIWFGLIVYEIMHRLYVRRVSIQGVATLGSALLFVALGIGYALSLMGFDASFIFDRNLGGRLTQFDALESVAVLPGRPFETIGEIVYLSVMQSFGAVGFVAFLIAITAPLGAHFLGVLPFRDSDYKRSLAGALVVYLVIAVSDGGMLYIPVMAFFWFVVSLMLSDNPSFGDIEGAPSGASPSRVG